MTGINCNVKMSGYEEYNLDNERREESIGNGEGIQEGVEDGRISRGSWDIQKAGISDKSPNSTEKSERGGQHERRSLDSITLT